MPEGDVELGHHLRKKWCADKDLVRGWNDGLDLCVTTVPTKHVQPLYPLWDGALLIT